MVLALWVSPLERVRTVAEALASASSVDAVAQAAVRASMSALRAEAGSISLLEPGTRTLHPSAAEGFPANVVERFRSFGLDDPLPVPDAIRAGEPIVVPHARAFAERWPHLAPTASASPKAYAIAPLHAGEHIVGGLLFAWREERAFTADDTDLLATLGTLVGAAIHRAMLHDAEARARGDAEERARREARLQHLTALLARAVSIEDVLAAVVDEGIPLVGARAGSLAFCDEVSGSIVVQRALGYPPELMQSLARVALPERTPLTDAARSGAPIFLRDGDARAATYPHLARARAVNGEGAMSALPLVASGRVVGAIGLNFPQAREFEPEERAFLVAFAQQSAQALERARLLASEREARLHAARNETLSALGRLVSGVAHELRTPLTAIQNNAALARMRLERSAATGGATPETAVAITPFLDGVDDGVHRIDALVGQLRGLYRPGSSKRGARALDELARDAVRVFGIAHPGADLQADLAPTPQVNVDVFELQQALFNLMQNALDATPPGGPAVRVTSGVAEDGAAFLEVRDQGAGIPPEVQARLFQPLFTTKAEGMGLGLSIARRVVESHGGTLTFTSEPGRGTTFRVRLPRA